MFLLVNGISGVDNDKLDDKFFHITCKTVHMRVGCRMISEFYQQPWKIPMEGKPNIIRRS